MALLDLGLWMLAAGLAVPALWWSRRQPREWDPARLFRGIRGQEDLSGVGEAWQPSEWLGAGITWENLGEARPGRRLEGMRVLWLGDATLPLPGLPAARLAPPPRFDPIEAAWESELEKAAGTARQLVLAAGPDQGMNLLKLLHAAPGLRDRCVAVLLIDLQPDPSWLAAEFTHGKMDTELLRQIPYLCLNSRLDGGVLPMPPAPPTSRTAIEVVDLGIGDPQDPTLGHAVMLLIAALAW